MYIHIITYRRPCKLRRVHRSCRDDYYSKPECEEIMEISLDIHLIVSNGYWESLLKPIIHIYPFCCGGYRRRFAYL